MAIYAVIQRTLDAEKIRNLVNSHTAFLKKEKEQGNIFVTGPFNDGTGGLILYVAETLDQARQIAEEDPFIKERAAEYELHEWTNYTERL